MRSRTLGLVRIVVMNWWTWRNGLPSRLHEDTSSLIQLAQIKRFRMASVASRAPRFPEHPAAMTLLEIALLGREALLVSELIRDLPMQCALIFLDCEEQVGPLGSGTPEGVEMAATPARWRLPGDRVSVEIEGIGSLSNPLMGANFLLVRFQPERLF